jgi:hypothetical protein
MRWLRLAALPRVKNYSGNGSKRLGLLMCNPSRSSNHSGLGQKTSMNPRNKKTLHKNTDSRWCLNRGLKKLGMMMLLLAETGFPSYGTHSLPTQDEMRPLIIFHFSRTSRVYQDSGYGFQRGGENLQRCCGGGEEQEPAFVFPSVSSFSAW